MIVYILGAGASAGTASSYSNYYRLGDSTLSIVPPVLQVKERLKFLISNFDGYFKVENITTSDPYIDSLRTSLLQIKEDLQWMSNEMAGEAFADILAETLHNNSIEGDYKKFINIWGIFLIIQQLLNGVDQRYKVFFTNWFSSMPGNDIPNNLTIFNWNQDYQIEEALVEKRQLYTESKYNSIVERGIYSRNKFIRENNSRIETPHFRHFKLNGSATLLESKANSYNMCFKLIKSSNPSLIGYELLNNISSNNQIDEIAPIRIKQMTTELSFLYRYIKSKNFTTSIHFAWDESREKLQKQIDELSFPASSKALVCIGYSFPLLNARIDRAIIKKCNPEKIYIQCLASEANSIKAKVIAIWGENKEPIMLTYNDPKDINEFYIPYEGLAENFDL